MKRLLAALPLLCAMAWAQLPPECVGSTPAAGMPCQVVPNYNGSNQLTSLCYARSVDALRRPNTTVAISAVSNASPAVMTATGHGFALGSRPQVTITGFTVGWLTANGTWTATVVDANTFSIVLDSTAFGALSGTPIFSTTAPRSTVAEWAIRLMKYDASGNLIGQFWMGGNMSLVNLCTSTALSATQAQ